MLVPVDEWYQMNPFRIDKKPTDQMLDSICSGCVVYVGVKYVVGTEDRTTMFPVHLDNIYHAIDQDGNRCDTYDAIVSEWWTIPDQEVHGFVFNKGFTLEWKYILEFDSSCI